MMKVASGSPVVNALTLGTSWVRVEAVDNGDETVTLRISNLDSADPIMCAAMLTDLAVGPTVRSNYLALQVTLAPGKSVAKTQATVPGSYRVQVNCDGATWRYLVSPGSVFNVSPRLVA